MIQPKRSTCRRCGAPIAGTRRTFCSHECRRRHDRAAFAEAYRVDPETRRRQRARTKAGYHLRTAEPCAVCGTTDDVQRHHHRGYNRPLDIQWVCRGCHARIHAAERRRAA